jgi:hypothetical protein
LHRDGGLAGDLRPAVSASYLRTINYKRGWLWLCDLGRCAQGAHKQNKETLCGVFELPMQRSALKRNNKIGTKETQGFAKIEK